VRCVRCVCSGCRTQGRRPASRPQSFNQSGNDESIASGPRDAALTPDDYRADARDQHCCGLIRSAARSSTIPLLAREESVAHLLTGRPRAQSGIPVCGGQLEAHSEHPHS
jgi:hypothetical protein